MAWAYNDRSDSCLECLNDQNPCIIMYLTRLSAYFSPKNLNLLSHLTKEFFQPHSDRRPMESFLFLATALTKARLLDIAARFLDTTISIFVFK
jgi:hypothetical protein